MQNIRIYLLFLKLFPNLKKKKLNFSKFKNFQVFLNISSYFLYIYIRIYIFYIIFLIYIYIGLKILNLK